MRQLAGGSPVLSSACLLLRLIAACPRADVSPLRQAREGRERCSRADRELGWHSWPPPQRPHRKAIHQLVASPTVWLASLGLLRCDGPFAQGPWAGPVCVCLSEGLQGLGEPRLTEAFTPGVSLGKS